MLNYTYVLLIVHDLNLDDLVKRILIAIHDSLSFQDFFFKLYINKM